jgi:L-2,4-diaminobutyric acid acetyltransferase
VIDWQTRTVALWSFVDPFTSGSAAGGSSSPPCPVLFATPQTPLSTPTDEPESITIRPPTPADGPQMWRLAERSGGLDLNSPYAYLLAGHHFAGTSVVAETVGGDLAGFVVAYPPPDRSDLVFVWQVTVAQAHRGSGLAGRMLHAVIDRASRRGALGLTATVTPSNEASRGLFAAVARERHTGFSERPCFGAELFPGDGHEPEHEIYVGPFAAAGTATHPIATGRNTQ